MQFAFIISLVFLIVSGAVSQDIKIDVSKITYSSEFEKKSFEAFHAKTPDYFALLLAPDETVTSEQHAKWKATFEKELNGFKTELDTKKKNDKRVKFLYDKVHERFLAKYEEINLFSQVFKDGLYNCVSATGLYSLAFDHFKIPYSVQEKPTHVYLVAYPDVEPMQIETTTPIGGYYEFDQTFKQNYVKKLTDYKLISQVEFQTKSVDELFDKHFFNSESIDITKLVGIQYLNSGLYLYEKREYEKASYQFEKSYYLYPSEKARYLLFASIGNVFNALSYSDEKKGVYVAKLSKFTKEGINKDAIIAEFYRINQKVFLQDGDKEKYEKIYNTIQESLEDESIKKEISYIYHYENGRILYNQGRHTDAQPFLEKALTAKPNNADLAGLFLANLKQLESFSKDKPAFIKQLQQYSETYPTLKDHANFNYLLTSNVLEVFEKAYDKGNTKDGETYRLMFEETVSKTKNFNTSMVEYSIGRAYSSACVYYFKIGQKSKAKSIVEKGLSYVPDNYQLKQRKEVLNR